MSGIRKNFSQNGGIYFRCQTFFCLLVNYFTTSVVRLIYICVWTFLSKMFSARLTNFTIFFTTNHIMFLMCCVEIQSLRYYCCFRSSGSTISLSERTEHNNTTHNTHRVFQPYSKMDTTKQNVFSTAHLLLVIEKL